MNVKIANRYYFGVTALFMILGLAASCTRNLSVTPSVVVSLNTPTPTLTFTLTSTNTSASTATYTSTSTSTSTNTPTSTSTSTNSFTPTNTPVGPSYTPTFTFTNTDTGTPTFTSTNTNTPTNTNTSTMTFTSTNTPTNTNTMTNTATPTNTSAPPRKFEDWEGPYPGGNHWFGFTTCGQANYVVNPASSGEAITICYDSTPGDAHSGTYCLHSSITWNTCGPTQYAQEGIDSSYSGYGFPVSIDSSTNAVQTANHPASISIWLKCDTAGQQFTVYMQDATYGSGTVVHTTHYQNGGGTNYLFTFTTAGVWQNFVLPLTAGTSIWDVDPTILNWNAILDVGVVYAAPPSCAPGQVINIYMDDYNFLY
jgi:hypothetical protein